MTSTTYRHKTLIVVLLVIILGLLVNLWFGFIASSPSLGMLKIKTLEPLLIAGPLEDDNVYALPPGTLLFQDTGFAEGHVRYLAYFYHKGAFAHEEVPADLEHGPTLGAPTWLYNVDLDNPDAPIPRPPMTRDDIVQAVRAGQVTRQDLSAILRSLPK
ncbi:hypothetical protein [Pseudomonas sp. CF161]|jgi:hypothetical protein|uniref:hypothetical protein n=1 Tax=Pseudomonas sp. CF161 TaxID=911241 RepID=UPI0003552883|nr:hypothetical protein [Pseudomonas sp. CF161]EPL03533.1 hypothetical protein CF161_31460 [Pseudomonas sp. CF161]